MTKNEGTVDRVVRVVAGLVGVCPAYSVFGISTCPAKK